MSDWDCTLKRAESGEAEVRLGLRTRNDAPDKTILFENDDARLCLSTVCSRKTSGRNHFYIVSQEAPSAPVKASFNFSPARSQVVLLSFAFIGGVSLCVSFWFLFKQLNTWYIPFLTGSALLCTAFLGWSRSRKDVDRDGASPFVVRVPGIGAEISSDIRALDQRPVKEMFAALVTAVAHQSKLPEPDGIVGPDLKPVPDSQLLAAERVKMANDEAEKRQAIILATLARRDADPPVAQIPRTDVPTSIPLEHVPPQRGGESLGVSGPRQ